MAFEKSKNKRAEALKQKSTQELLKAKKIVAIFKRIILILLLILIIVMAYFMYNKAPFSRLIPYSILIFGLLINNVMMTQSTKSIVDELNSRGNY